MNKKNKLNVVSSEAGAATVESALVLTVFLLLIFGIIEFSLIIFKASSLVEATRAGARYLIVNDPVVDLDGFDCGNPPEPSSCEDNSGCNDVVSLMQKFYEPLTASQIYVGYKCSSTGYDEAYFKIYEVQVSVKDAVYNFITPGILGMGLSITLPEFETTRISEDLEKVDPDD